MPLLRARSQKSVLPPYGGSTEADEVLAVARLHVGDTEVEPGGTCRDTRSNIGAVNVSLSLDVPQEAIDALVDASGIAADYLDLVITGRVSFLKWEDILVVSPLSAGSARHVLSSTPRPRVLRARHTGFDIVTSIVLSADRPQTRGQAWREGSALATATFRVRPLADLGFQPEQLTPELRAKLGLPKTTSRFFMFTESQPWEVSSADELLTAYVDDTLLQLMGGSSPFGKQLQSELAASVYSAIFARCAARGGELPDDEVIEDSLLGELCTRVEDSTGAESGSIIDELRKGESERAAALADAMTDLQGAFLEILKGGETDGV
jgi:hypothetical protein